ncbi:MAG TPA: FtsX-like permease family protein, partial [Bryobacteraceae bacterium]|nr:FtsX-like permease family protein [Bryobacteraceae bacterium]
VIALLLSGIGLYTVHTYTVSRRTQELGIRIAVGAAARDILRLVMAQGMLQAILGVGIGLLLSLALNRVLKSELIHISPADPITLLAACVISVLAAAAGCLVPARRATRMNPTVALRRD